MVDVTYDHNYVIEHMTARPLTHPDHKGWSVCVIEIREGETAYMPGTTKHAIHGPTRVQYDIHASGILAKHLDVSQYRAMCNKIAEWRKQRLTVGQVVSVKLPWSEVCMHMHVQDQVRNVRVLEHGAQILNDDGTPFSAPITHSEAGIYRDAEGLYV